MEFLLSDSCLLQSSDSSFLSRERKFSSFRSRGVSSICLFACFSFCTSQLPEVRTSREYDAGTAIEVSSCAHTQARRKSHPYGYSFYLEFMENSPASKEGDRRIPVCFFGNGGTSKSKEVFKRIQLTDIVVVGFKLSNQRVLSRHPFSLLL